MDRATLCYLFNDNDVLLIKKKRGFGKGKYSAPGGKIEDDEQPSETAVREVKEETDLTVYDLNKVGKLTLVAGKNPVMLVYIFTSRRSFGTAIESDEAIPRWFSCENIPYDRMWADNKYWMPNVLNRVRFRAKSVFDESMKELIRCSISFPDSFHDGTWNNTHASIRK
jgi:8-oxo-dGTP diphosphatase